MSVIFCIEASIQSGGAVVVVAELPIVETIVVKFILTGPC
jgi:hypothetical protein